MKAILGTVGVGVGHMRVLIESLELDSRSREAAIGFLRAAPKAFLMDAMDMLDERGERSNALDVACRKFDENVGDVILSFSARR